MFRLYDNAILILLAILGLIGYISLGSLPYLFSFLEPLVQQIAKDIIHITMYITPIMTNKVYKNEPVFISAI